VQKMQAAHRRWDQTANEQPQELANEIAGAICPGLALYVRCETAIRLRGVCHPAE
jgi:hypothetical protein